MTSPHRPDKQSWRKCQQAAQWPTVRLARPGKQGLSVLAGRASLSAIAAAIAIAASDLYSQIFMTVVQGRNGITIYATIVGRLASRWACALP